MNHASPVAVLGLGLIGGSLARDLAALGVDVWGWDRDPGSLRRALDAGAVTTPLEPTLAGVAGARAVVLAVPVQAAEELLAQAAPHLGRTPLVTDVGSTKTNILAAAIRLGLGPRFVGAHPLAGDHRSGWEAARPDLFRGERVYLCPTAETSGESMGLARSLWAAVGAVPEVLDAGTHDRRVALTSHLPQAVSTALALVLDAAGIDPADLGPGGRDLTRLAASPPDLWTGIALDNAAALDDAVAALETRLRDFRHLLAKGDLDDLRRLFESARRWTAR